MSSDSIWKTDGGVYLGYGAECTEGEPPTITSRNELRYGGDRHICLIGNSGSGKSRRWILPNLAYLTGFSMIVIDPKGELLRMCHDHRAHAGNEQIVFNPFDLFSVGSRGWNPLSALDPATDDFSDDAMGQAEGIVEVPPREPHWTQSFQDVLAALAMYVRIVIPNGTYGDVRALLAQSDPMLRKMIMDREFIYNGAKYPGMMAAGIMHNWEEIGHKAARFGAISPEQRELHSILSTGLTETRFLDSRQIKRELSGPAFDFREMKQRPITVWVTLPSRRLVTHAKWMRLILSVAVQSLMSDTRPSKVPVAIICDETAALGHMPIFENTVAQMRGHGLKLITVFQDLAQLKTIYARGWESFIGNAGVLQSFAAQDIVTADYLSARSGMTTEQTTSYGISQNLHPRTKSSYSTSATRSAFQRPLMLPQDVRNMDEGFSLIFSHRIKGTGRAYLPFPSALPGLEAICALDPARSP